MGVNRRDSGFDYRSFGACQVCVGMEGPREIICWEPATHEVWWHPDTTHRLLVCEKHFGEIQRAEDECEPA